MKAQFTTGVTTEGNPCELLVSGDVDLAVTDDLYDAAACCFTTDAPGLVIDLSGVTFLDTTGIGALVRIRNTSRDLNKTLLLAHPPEHVVRVLSNTGLDDVFDINVDFRHSRAGSDTQHRGRWSPSRLRVPPRRRR